MPVQFGAPGVFPSLRGQPSNLYALQAGEVMLIPAGDWYAILGKYLSIQVFDQITGMWRWAGDNGQGAFMVHSDGVNFRVANQTGCAIGAVITTAGSAYTTAPTCTASAGGSVWQTIIGGLVNTTVVVSNGGTNYGYAPQVIFDAPPTPGYQATGYCTLSAGAVSTVTVVDQGAGYINAPGVTFRNDPREGSNGVTVGSGAAAYTTLTGAGTLTGLWPLDHGTPLTSAPTLSFSSGAAAATVLMDFTLTGYTATVGGALYTTAGAAGAVEVSGVGGFVAAGANTNPTMERGSLRRRRARIYAPTTTAGAITATGAIVDDGGHYEAVPSVIIEGGSAVITTAATLALGVGGTTDTFALLAA